LLLRIFDPFFTTKPRGHGLGLATGHSIMRRHGGCIEVESEQGRGSVFHLFLPAAKDTGSLQKSMSASMHKGEGTILVMDDEETIRDTFAAMLKSLGYSVVCLDNGRSAVDFFKKETGASFTLQALFFDLTIPGGMGGREAIAEIRKLDNTRPAFVVSGYADDPVVLNPVEYGFTAGLCKPFRKAELVEMLEKHLIVQH
jgi:CheY-like chemotaxis protein